MRLCALATTAAVVSAAEPAKDDATATTPGGTTETPGGSNGEGGNNNGGSDNKPTGVALAIAPVVLAGAAVAVISKKRK